MHIIPRALEGEIIEKLTISNKAIIIYGPRQVGKTTLVKKIIKTLPYKTLSINADEKRYIDILSSGDLRELTSLVTDYDLLFIDEAQRIPDIGINLKILIDNLPTLKIIATGSSSFELANKVSEPLTGRTWTYTLYPIASQELRTIYNSFELSSQVEQQLVFGCYPEIFTLSSYKTKKQYLELISSAYLYKDVLELTRIEHPGKIHRLLQLLAFQIGSEVSLTELGTTVGMSKDTVAKYIDLLEKSFVIFRIKGFSRNLRKELTKMDKIYFYDLGIRNILIDNLKSLKDRNDVGQLWENFLMIERKKLLSYTLTSAHSYFWRTYTGAELDYIEEREELLYGYEFKYKKTSIKIPPSWAEHYPNNPVQVIHKENYLDFVLNI